MSIARYLSKLGALLNSNGQVLTTGIAGGGTPSFDSIKFPASQVTSADANTLDDYEEGTWTPVWQAPSGSVGYAAQIGTYTKIGRMVTIYVHLITNAKTGFSGQLSMGNLPFVSSSAANYCVGPMHAENCTIAAAAWAWGYVAPGTQTAYFRYWLNNSAAGTMDGSQLNINSDVMFSATYFV